jgi:O-antigen/teichoic acid export membrane protein
MSLQRTVARNVILSWAGTCTHMLAGFFVARFLVQQLGQSQYGLWILIASMTGYLDLLDFGLRGALGRNLAVRKAEGDTHGLQVVFSTGLSLMIGGALLVLAAIAPARLAFFALFDVPETAAPDVDRALILIGGNLALIFLFNIFEATLWANQRFDLIQAVYIPATVTRAALTLTLVGPESDSLVTLGWIHVGVTLGMGAALGALALRAEPGLRFSPRLFRVAAVRQLFGVGVWCFLQTMARIASAYLGTLLVGTFFGTRQVTPYAFASRLVEYANTFMIAAGVVTPLATAWHAEKKERQQRWLFLEGGKLCWALALFFAGGLFLLGGTFLHLWTGQHLEYAAVILAVLVCGELLPLSQKVSYGTVFAMNRHWFAACMCAVEVALVPALALALMAANGDPTVVTIAVAVAIPTALCRGMLPLMFACRVLGVSLPTYAARAVLPPALAAVPPVAALALAVAWHMPETWPELIAFGAGYTLAFGAAVVFFVIGFSRTKEIAAALLARAQPRGEGGERAEADAAAPEREPAAQPR